MIVLIVLVCMLGILAAMMGPIAKVALVLFAAVLFFLLGNDPPNGPNQRYFA